MPRYRAETELPLRLAPRREAGPIPAQIVEQVRDLVASGRLRPGDLVPSTRALAARLGISRGSVTTAWDQLAGEGYLVADAGGTRITPELPRMPRPPRAPAPSRGRESAGTPGPSRRTGTDLRPGTPDASALATTAWRAAWRAAAADPGPGHGPAGSPELRHQLAEYLRLLRSVLAPPEDVVVTAGARDGLRTLLGTLEGRRRRKLVIAVEDPGYPSLHRVPQALGHAVVPVPVDDQGLDPARLPDGRGTAAPRPDLVLLAPSHQYPLGASMPASRRLELLGWAEEHDALLVEDDYDSELRYVGDPLPALAALDRPAGAESLHPGRLVVTLGSFAKLLTPGLGLGSLLVPGGMREEVLAHRRDTGAPVSVVVQDAMAAFLAEDGLRRHTARMRREYRRRRDVLTEVFSAGRAPAGVTVLPMDGGLHAVLELPGPEAERRVVESAAAAGIRVSGLGEYWSAGGASAGVVVGFGGLPERRLRPALEVLRETMSAVLRP